MGSASIWLLSGYGELMRPSRFMTLIVTPGIGVKRWLFIIVIAIFIIALGISLLLLKLSQVNNLMPVIEQADWSLIAFIIIMGMVIISYAIFSLGRNLVKPYRIRQSGSVIDTVVEYSQRQKGFKYVAIGGGTGLPASLRGMKNHTGKITAIVTVADDGGSSGRLRRDMGVLPPGDLRSNIAALADDNSLLTKLFQYRFQSGDLEGHSFGNLFIAALSSIVNKQGDTNSLATALIEVSKVLNIRGRVLPATLQEVNITAEIMLTGSSRSIKVLGESQIESVDGHIDRVEITPVDVAAYDESVQAILDADIIVVGPGSLYTSILPNLLVKGISDALKRTPAYKIYVCNVATQPVETENYSVADHIIALEKHTGRGIFHAVIANNAYPQENAGDMTNYVSPIPENHELLQRYQVYYTDLTDTDRPWRHDTEKLCNAILRLTGQK
ncbi:MAG: gluconeogenesis factor YvcK family protein [Aggregatilineales bacterium]